MGAGLWWGRTARTRVQVASRAVVEVDRSIRYDEARTVASVRLGRLNARISYNVRRDYAGAIGTREAGHVWRRWLVVLSVGWHDRDSYVHGYGYQGNHCLWFGRGVRDDRLGRSFRAKGLSAGWDGHPYVAEFG